MPADKNDEKLVPQLPASPQADAPDLFYAVGEAYDHYRLARLNVKYYGRRLQGLRAANFWFDVAVAVGTSGTIASMLSGNAAGQSLTVVLASFAAVLGVLKPVLGLSKRLERVTRLWTEHNFAFTSLRRAVADIGAYHMVRPEAAAVVAFAAARMDQLSSEDDPNPSQKLLERLQEEVNREIPRDELWWPTDDPRQAA